MSIRALVARGKDKVVVTSNAVCQVVEGVTSIAATGVAVDRTAKIITGVGIATTVVGVVVGAKAVALAGIGCVMGGFVHGFRQGIRMTNVFAVVPQINSVE